MARTSLVANYVHGAAAAVRASFADRTNFTCRA